MAKLNGDLLQNLREITDFKFSGIYFLLKEEEVVYVGRSQNVWTRLETHLKERSKDFNRVFYLPVEESELSEMELRYILEYRPTYNKTPPNGGYITKASYKEFLVKRVGFKIPSFVIDELFKKHQIKPIELNFKLLFSKKTVDILEKDLLSNKPLREKLSSEYIYSKWQLKDIKI